MIESTINREKAFQLRINFNLKSLKKVGIEKSQIWLTTTINGERVRIYTKLLVKEEHWLKKCKSEIGECVKEDASLGNIILKENRAINKQLRKIIEYCQEYGTLVSERHLYNDPIEYSGTAFKAFIEAKIRGVEASYSKSPKSFIEAYIQRKCEMINRDTGRRIADGTIYNHKNALKRIEDFCREKGLNFTWQIFNKKFEEIFTAWLIGKNYTPNTIAAQYSIIKVWLKEAEENNFINDKAFHHYQTKCRNVENIYLTENELERLYNIDFTSEEIRQQIDPQSRIEITRDLFIVACWTGLRYSDWRDLSTASLTEKFMTVRTHKTDKTVVIPIHPMVKSILEKYNGELPRSVDRSKTLRHIRKCAEIAGINELVTLTKVVGGKSITSTKPKYEYIMNHTARRTFATLMYLKRVPSISIMAITGHTTEDNFLKYIKVSKEEHAKIVAKAFTVR